MCILWFYCYCYFLSLRATWRVSMIDLLLVFLHYLRQVVTRTQDQIKMHLFSFFLKILGQDNWFSDRFKSSYFLGIPRPFILHKNCISFHLFDIESCIDFSNKDFDKCRTVHSKTAGVFFPLFFVSMYRECRSIFQWQESSKGTSKATGVKFFLRSNFISYNLSNLQIICGRPSYVIFQVLS